MKKRILPLLLALVLCCGLCVPAGAAASNETHTETFDYSGEIWEIPNVTKVGYAAWIGGYEDAEGNVTYYDPTGWQGFILNDTVGYPVYYVSGDSVTLHRSGASNDSWFNSWKVTETGSFSFDAMMSALDFSQFPAAGVGFAKCEYDDTVGEVPLSDDGTSVTLGKGVWAGPGFQDFTSFLVVVGDDDALPEDTPSSQAGFTDVDASAYYHDPVAWAVEQDIAKGTTTTTFSPYSTCTRAQIITFLWRAAGEPEPEGDNSFTDVTDKSAYYYKATAWAAEQGLVSGTTFAPNDPCTRAMAVEFMWKQAGSPSAAKSDFTDVSASDSYAEAVDWALAAGVTTGSTASTFNPSGTCTRAQIVTFLYRADQAAAQED